MVTARRSVQRREGGRYAGELIFLGFLAQNQEGSLGQRLGLVLLEMQESSVSELGSHVAFRMQGQDV